MMGSHARARSVHNCGRARPHQHIAAYEIYRLLSIFQAHGCILCIIRFMITSEEAQQPCNLSLAAICLRCRQ